MCFVCVAFVLMLDCVDGEDPLSVEVEVEVVVDGGVVEAACSQAGTLTCGFF